MDPLHGIACSACLTFILDYEHIRHARSILAQLAASCIDNTIRLAVEWGMGSFYRLNLCYRQCSKDKCFYIYSFDMAPFVASRVFMSFLVMPYLLASGRLNEFEKQMVSIVPIPTVVVSLAVVAFCHASCQPQVGKVSPSFCACYLHILKSSSS